MAVNSPRQNRKPTAEALTELAARLAQHGTHAKVWVHDGMTVAMTHRESDATATIDDALVDGTELVEEMAAEIAAERRLPPDWLGWLIIEDQPPPRSRLATMCERSLLIVVRTAARLAARCVGVARQAQASRLKKRWALAGIRIAYLVVKLARKTPSIGRRHRGVPSQRLDSSIWLSRH
ncbi:hypothetical protein [Candidatus Poriferisodalis sp.]|uniref:hypothetical protein n=1 Tax=Candidatus Poriferisodalis sp. TaxID=3101277 RepID=UPI003B0112F4